MKRIILITILIVGLTATYSFADMGSGRMGSGQGMMGSGQGMMGSGQGMMGSGQGMMDGHEVTGGLMHNMGQMSRLMQQLRDMMANKPDAERTSKMSVLMQDMSEHIEEMSKIMKRGSITQEEMQMLDQHNRKMQEAYEKMRW